MAENPEFKVQPTFPGVSIREICIGVGTIFEAQYLPQSASFDHLSECSSSQLIKLCRNIIFIIFAWVVKITSDC